MPRPILDEAHIHPAIRGKIATRHADVVRAARRLLDAAGGALEDVR